MWDIYSFKLENIIAKLFRKKVLVLHQESENKNDLYLKQLANKEGENENNEPDKQNEKDGGKDGDKDEEKIETPQQDPRFPNQNQTCHCWSAYVDFHRSLMLLGEGHKATKYFKKTYTSMCPNSWVERWDDQRENGTFPAIIHRVKLEKDSEQKPIGKPEKPSDKPEKPSDKPVKPPDIPEKPQTKRF